MFARFWADHVAHRLAAILAALALMAGVAGATSAYPFLIDAIVDAFGARAADVVVWGPLAVVAATTVKGVCLYGQTVLTNAAALGAVTDLQKRAFAKLHALDFARLSAEAPGSAISRFLNDVNAVREAMLRAANSLVRDVLTLIGLVIALVVMDWQLAIVALVILPVAIAPVNAIGRRVRKVAEATQVQAADLSGALEESVGAARLVKTYGLEAREAGRVAGKLEERRALQLKAAEQKGRIDPILEVLGGVGIAGVVAFAGWRIVSGETDVGNFAGFLTALLLAGQSVRSLGGLHVVLQEGRAALTRFYDLLDQAPTIIDAPDAAPLALTDGAVRFDDVGFSHAGAGAVALAGVSFEARRGQLVALVGPSGSGKSTLLNLVPRLFDVTHGGVTIDGQDVRSVRVDSLRAAISVVSQDATLFDDTIAANIALGRAGASRAQIEAAARAAACDFAFTLPGGLDAPVGPRGTRLSGGERQRVSLARAILRDAPILLLDEATSALDADSEARVQEALERFAATRTTIVVAHRLATVRRADLILVLQDGRIVERGTHAGLTAAGGAYADLAALQLVAPVDNR